MGVAAIGGADGFGVGVKMITGAGARVAATRAADFGEADAFGDAVAFGEDDGEADAEAPGDDDAVDVADGRGDGLREGAG